MTVISPWLTLVFALLAARAALAPALRLSPKAVGIGEIVATLLVSVTALVVV